MEKKRKQPSKLSLQEVGNKKMSQPPSHTLHEKEQMSKLKPFMGAEVVCSLPGCLLTQSSSHKQ